MSARPLTSAVAGDDNSIGQEMHALLTRLFPICRSLTGDGVRETLAILAEHIPLKTYEVPSGTQVFDWTIPKEWNIREAFVEDEQGNRVIDFSNNNLHVVGYSIPVDKEVELSELQEHLHSLPDQPDAIPYVTSYYKENWGFCISENERKALAEGRYRVRIDSDLKDGHLSYAECVIPGETSEEIFLSTYVCHPSMANNELSGPVVTTYLAKWIASAPRRYTYRIIFIPETIGAITYLSRNLDILKDKVKAGFVITCIGDDHAYSYVQSRYGNTYADKVAECALKNQYPGFLKYSFLKRGSDERQYSSPGVDLPMVTLSRSKFHEYPEYHTSLDNLDYVTETGLQGGFELLKNCVLLIENNRKYRVTCRGEPQLGKRGLYPDSRIKNRGVNMISLLDFVAYADGSNDLIDISTIAGIPITELYGMATQLYESGLLSIDSEGLSD